MANDASPHPRALRILVTGASGLVGRALCAALAARGHAVVAMLHRAAAPPGSGAVAMQGDVTADGLGLDPSVARGLDLVVHCAAVTAFNLAPAVYERVNVGGTAQVLAFAAQAMPAVSVLHVSTAYVCGTQDGAVPEAPSAASRFNNGYEASKAAAEALVLAAHARGQAVAIARPSIVAGDWASGAIGAFGSLYQLIRLVAEGRTGALPAAPGASLNLVPIDHVVGGLADIAERMPQADGRIVHLAAADPVPLAALTALAAEYPHLHPPRFVQPEQFDPARLSPRQRWFHERIARPHACYLRPSPRFVTANLAALSGRTCPPTDAGYVRRLIHYAMAAGFLPADGAEARQRTSG